MPGKRPESRSHPSNVGLPSDFDMWLKEFLFDFELRLVAASNHLTAFPSTAERQAAAARAIVETFVSSGTDIESVMELFGQIAINQSPRGDAWTDALNRRRFALIDKEIQGTLTPAETMELAGLTRLLRDHVESEIHLPMAGARALHEKLLQLKSTGQSD